METFLNRIAKLTASMPDSAMPTPVETSRSTTPSQATSDNFALTAGTMIAGWAMSGLKKQVLGNDVNGNRPESASTQPPVAKPLETPSELKGLGSVGDLETWREEEFDDSRWNTSQSQRPKQNQNSGMKLHVKNKKSVVEKVVEEEKSKAPEAEEEDSVESGAWGFDEWDDDGNDGWGFDDE
jgi:hypothetical protein